MNVVFYSMPLGPNPEIFWEVADVAASPEEGVITTIGGKETAGRFVRLVRYEHGQQQMVLQRVNTIALADPSGGTCHRMDVLVLAVILFTSDDLCVLRRQLNPPDEVGPSVTAFLNPSDFDGVRRLSQFDPLRSVCEELGVRRHQVKRVHVMGLIRAVQHDEAPMLMYRGHLNVSSGQLRSQAPRGVDLVFADVLSVDTFPKRSASLDDLLTLLVREDMGR